MFKDYLIIDKNMIPSTALLLAKEFDTAPLTNYIFPDEATRKKVLPLIFESLLSLYQESGITFVTSEKLEATFSLIDSQKSINHFSYYSAIIKSIPKILKTIANIEVIETTKKLIDIEKKLNPIFTFIKNKENYIFVSSIGAKDNATKDKFIPELLKVLTTASNSTLKPLLVETETLEMVNLYKDFGFNLVKEISVDANNVIVYLLEYTPK